MSRNLAELLTISEDSEPEECLLLTDLVSKQIELDKVKVVAPLLHLKEFEALKQKLQQDNSYKATQIVPECFRLELLRNTHALGHLGIVKMATLLTNNGLF